MFFIMMMSILFIDTNNPRYYTATTKSVEAVYQDSDVRNYVITAEDKLRHAQPLLSKAAPIAYGVFYKKSISFKNDRIAVSSDLRTKDILISYTWRW